MIETERLVLRSWQERDNAPFAELGQDAEVMATLGPLLSRAESDAMVDRMAAIDAEHGHTFWAVERRADGAMLGFCGLVRGRPGTPILGEPEIGWRLARAAWVRGTPGKRRRRASPGPGRTCPIPRSRRSPPSPTIAAGG